VIHDDDLIGDLERLLLIVRDEDAGDADLLVERRSHWRNSMRTLASRAPKGSSSSSTLGCEARAGPERRAAVGRRRVRRIAIAEAVETHEV